MSTTISPVDPPGFLHVLAHDLRWKLVMALSRGDHHVKELIAVVNQPPNLVSYHLKRLRDSRLVTERRSSADGRDVYYSLDLDRLHDMYTAAGEAIHPGLVAANATTQEIAREKTIKPTRILFLCTRNSARSQMAEAIMRQLGGIKVEVFSAGSEPSSLHPDAITVMAALGIDLTQQASKHLDLYCNQTFDYIITVCDRVREACPMFPGDPEQIHWSFSDPATIDHAKARFRAFEQTATELFTRIRHLLVVIERERRG